MATLENHHPLHLDVNILEVMLALSPTALAALSAAARGFAAAVRSALPTLATTFQRPSLPLASPPSLWHLLCYHTLSNHGDQCPPVRTSVVAAGRAHAAVVAEDGGAFLLGGVDRGAAEDEQRTPLTSFSRLALPWPSAAVACGAQHVLLLDVFGGLHSFGCGADGQLGHGGFNAEPSPRRVAILAGACVVDIAAGNAHSLALVVAAGKTPRGIDGGGRLYAWGLNEEGQLGLGSRAASPTPMAVSGTAHCGPGRVSCGDFHSAMVTVRGDLYTWGYGRAGRLGHGTEEDELQPKRVKAPSETSSLVDMSSMRHFSGVACGAAFTLACMGAGAFRKLWATGQGFDGQLGIGRRGQGAFETSLTFVQLPPGCAPFACLAVNDGVAALLEDGSVMVWGNTGVVAGDRLARPTLVPALRGCSDLAWGGGSEAAERFVLAAAADGTMGGEGGRRVWKLRHLARRQQATTVLHLE